MKLELPRPQLLRLMAAALLALAPAAAPTSGLVAETLTSETITRALAPKPKAQTRSIGAPTSAGPALPGADAAWIDRLPTRGLKVEMKEKLVEIVERNDLPRIDIDIRFAYNSADILPSSRGEVDALGHALRAPALAGARIALNGHTDAIGSDPYNMELSERRAEAVRDYLARHHGIDEYRLIAVGFGKRRLKNVHYPEAAENRRVEVVNLY